jgi:putative sigma-54 modulation protein
MGNKQTSIRVNLSFRNTEPTEPISKYAEEKIKNCVQKFAHHDTEVKVILMVEKNRHIAEATFNCDGSHFAGKEECDNLYASIDELVDSLSQQLRKHKEKMTKHH